MTRVVLYPDNSEAPLSDWLLVLLAYYQKKY
jgi:hypothetical protein